MRLVLKNNMLSVTVLFITGLFFIYKAIYFQPHDFANYYYAAFFLDGGAFNTLIYDPAWFNIHIGQYTENAFAAYAPNTPFLALFFTPFTLVSFGLAKILFNCISLLLFITSVYRLFIHYEVNLNYLLLILLLFLIPIQNNILFGQVYFLLFFLIAEGLLAYSKGKLMRMSIFWSLAILLKVFPIILVLFLILERKVKPVLYLSIASITLFLVSVLINGMESWLFYFKEIFPKASSGEISGEFVTNYQSFLMFFKHLFVESSQNKYLLFSSNLIFQIALISVKIIIVFSGIFISFKEKSTLKKFTFWIVASYLLSPYSSSYGSILLLFPLLYIFRNFSFKNVITFSFFLFALLIYSNLPNDIFYNTNLSLIYIKLFFLITFFYGLFIHKTFHLRNQFIMFTLSIVLGYSISYFNKPNKTQRESPLLPNEKVAFIIDYSIENNKLKYTYWNEKGLKTKHTDIIIKNYNNKGINITDKDIYVKGKLIVLPKSNKKRAAIINNNTLIYLSDYDRGYGFYRLIKMPL